MRALVTSGLILKSKNENTSTYKSVEKTVEITKIKNTSEYGCSYYGFCPNYKEEFPGEYISDYALGWCHLIKNKNKGLKLPVLKRGEIVDLT